MKIEVDAAMGLTLKEVFSGVLLETGEGNQIGICMRDDTLEINVCPEGKDTKNWWRVNMQKGKIEPLNVLATDATIIEDPSGGPMKEAKDG